MTRSDLEKNHFDFTQLDAVNFNEIIAHCTAPFGIFGSFFFSLIVVLRAVFAVIYSTKNFDLEVVFFFCRIYSHTCHEGYYVMVIFPFDPTFLLQPPFRAYGYVKRAGVRTCMCVFFFSFTIFL